MAPCMCVSSLNVDSVGLGSDADSRSAALGIFGGLLLPKYPTTDSIAMSNAFTITIASAQVCSPLLPPLPFLKCTKVSGLSNHLLVPSPCSATRARSAKLSGDVMSRDTWKTARSMISRLFSF
jgi:hypothetical protein